MNPNSIDHMYMHTSLMASAQSQYEQYVNSCIAKGQVPLTMKQLRKFRKKKKRWA